MYELFEKKLGIALSPNDYEIIKRIQETYPETEIKEALEIAYQNNAKRVQYVLKILNTKEKTNLPDWFDKEIKKEPMPDKELEECIECLKEFHNDDFEEWATKQRKENERLKRLK